MIRLFLASLIAPRLVTAARSALDYLDSDWFPHPSRKGANLKQVTRALKDALHTDKRTQFASPPVIRGSDAGAPLGEHIAGAPAIVRGRE